MFVVTDHAIFVEKQLRCLAMQPCPIVYLGNSVCPAAIGMFLQFLLHVDMLKCYLSSLMMFASKTSNL